MTAIDLRLRRRARAASAAACALALLAGCGGSGDAGGSGGGTPVRRYAVSGLVDGAVSTDVTVTLSGTPAVADPGWATTTATTDAAGRYTFHGIADGSYTLTPSRAGFRFTPGSLPAIVSGADVVASDFVSAHVTHTISGTVTGPVVEGVAVALSGDASAIATTDVAGGYAFAGVRDGDYTVTPALAGHLFTPASLAVTVSGADEPGGDFVSRVIPAVPAAPEGLAVTPADGAAILGWSGVPGATSYRVHHGTTAGVVDAVVEASGPGALVPGLANGERRWFAVSAVNEGGEGARSAPRCGVPTASSTEFGLGRTLELYDALCDDRLDASRWYIGSTFDARVADGAAVLSVDGFNLEPMDARGHLQQASIGVNAGGARVTTLSATVELPAAGTAVTGGALARAAVRLLYSPPSRRRLFPSPNEDLLVLEVGLVQFASGGPFVYRRAYHCDDGPCTVATSTGLEVVDPPSFGELGAGLVGAPASHDTPYRFTASLDQATEVLSWSVEGGPEFATSVGGTADPGAYLDATPAWSGVPLAGAGFQGAALATRASDPSLEGGGSATASARFDDVAVGLNGGAATLWDDFDGTLPSSGPVELSLARWNAVGAQSTLPSGDGSHAIHAEATSRGAATSTTQGVTLSHPERADVLQADVAVDAFAVTGLGTATASAVVSVQGRWANDGSSTTPGDATGDHHAGVNINLTAAGSTATWYVLRCSDSTCRALTPVASGTLLTGGAGAPPGVHALRVDYDPATSDYTFSVDGVAGTVQVAAASRARAPLKRVVAFANPGATAGTKVTLDARVNDVFVGSYAGGPIPEACTDLDPTPAASVTPGWVVGAAPPAIGGPVVDGTYALTATNGYVASEAGGPAGEDFRWRLRLSGDALEAATLAAGSPIGTLSGTYSTFGTTFMLQASCPATGIVFNEYSASGTELRLYSRAEGAIPPVTWEYVFTRE